MDKCWERYWLNGLYPKIPLFPIKIDAINGRSIRQSPYLPASKRKSWTGGREWNRALAAPERTSYGKPAINLPWLGMVYIYIYYYIILYYIIYIYITNNGDDLVMVYWANPTWPPNIGPRHEAFWCYFFDLASRRFRWDEMEILPEWRQWRYLIGCLMGLVY
jgi:hypothetical protein